MWNHYILLVSFIFICPFITLVDTLPTETKHKEKPNNIINIEKESLCIEANSMLSGIKTSKDNFNTELIKIYTIITNTKGIFGIKRERKQKDTIQNVLNNIIIETKYLLYRILKTNSFQNHLYDIDMKSLEHLSKLLYDLDILETYSKNNIMYEKKYWYLQFLGVSLDNSVLTYIKYKYWYINHYKSDFDKWDELPKIKNLARTVREIKYALDSKLAALELIGRKSITELVFIVTSTVKKSSTLEKDIKYLQEGGINILKGLAFTTVCFVAKLTFCTVTLGGLLSVEILIWLAILSRTITVEWS